MNQRRNLLIGLSVLGLALVAATLYITSEKLGEDDAQAVFRRTPYLQNVSDDQITICWETDEPTGGVITVSTEDGRLLTERKTEVPATRHEIRIDGLETGTAYRYRLEAHGVMLDPVQEGNFRTAPAPGNPFEFAVWGDSRKSRLKCGLLGTRILATGVPMMIHSGDFVGDGANLFEWNYQFFEPCRELLKSMVLWPAIGNHELSDLELNSPGRPAYLDTFALPGKEFYYSFDYGDAHFLVLDSNKDAWDDPEQYAFAERDLSATQARWRFVVLHHPVFNSGRGHESHIGMRTRYCPLFARHNIDMIIVGHEHNYQFSRPIRHEDEPQQERPYYHLVSGGGGAPLYDIRDDRLWSDFAAKVYHFVVIRVDGDRLTGQAIDIDGKVFHEFEIDKSSPPPEAASYEQIEALRLEREQVTTDAVEMDHGSAG